MKSTKFISGLFLLTILVSCNDVGPNRKLGKPPEVTTPGIDGLSSDLLRSHMHREKGAPVISYAEEIVKIFADSLPKNLYRPVPMMEKDDEGSEKNVITRTSLGRPGAECGKASTFKGIDERIADCTKKNGDASIWEGHISGASGEGTWRLVSLSGNREIWLDGRTGMVWSDLIKKDDKTSFNWCQASGNEEDNTPTELINCRISGDSVSLCHGSTLGGLSTQIKWRLPTRNDFLQADLNGSRFVLKNENDNGVWTATIRSRSAGRSEAWVYASNEGVLFAGKLNDTRQVRCIGAPIR